MEGRGTSKSKKVMNTEQPMYEWKDIPWRKLERNVFKLQKRIYQASQRGDIKTVHRLQRILVKSKSATLLAVRRVTQDNKGKKTAGIDGLASLTPTQRLKIAQKLQKSPMNPKAKPVRRIWIPKPDTTEKRPLGIPTIEDRARQALAKLALEPEWEARFEPNSYGFRPGRSCHDAERAIFNSIRYLPKFVLDADIAKCFDRINHKALLAKLGSFPKLRRCIKAWLKAGIMEGGKLFPTEEGTPQGGIISPLLANIALHGLENVIKSAFPTGIRQDGKVIKWSPEVIRYADDFLILHRDLDALKEAQNIAGKWLQGMGLEMKPSKTRITHTLKEYEGNVGFDFLGFHVKQYPCGKAKSSRNSSGEILGFTASIRPSKEAQKRILDKVAQIVDKHRSAPQEALINKLNPIIRGWGKYFSSVVSKEIFSKIDMLIFQKLRAWAFRRHPNKGRTWIANKYWHPETGKWIFGTNKERLFKLSDIPIKRHVKVQGIRSPYDGDWIYWSTRMGKSPETPIRIAKLLKVQNGKCPHCGLNFRPEDNMEVHHLDRNRNNNTVKNLVLLHRHCHDNAHIEVCNDNHQFIEEPDEGKLSRPVLKPSTNSDVCA